VTALLDVGDGGLGFALEPCQRPVLPRVEQVDEVVRHLRLLGTRRLGGADVHPPVHLHRVDRHQLPGRVAPGQVQGEGGLPRCRRADEHGVTCRVGHDELSSLAKQIDQGASRCEP
jgi:hypothetical protein